MIDILKKVERFNKNIERGIAFLDETLGRKDWVKKINPKKLDMGNEKICVTGQLFGDYFDFTEKFELTEKQSCRMGFNVPAEDVGSLCNSNVYDRNVYDRDQDFELLAVLWFQKINSLKM